MDFWAVFAFLDVSKRGMGVIFGGGLNFVDL